MIKVSVKFALYCQIIKIILLGATLKRKQNKIKINQIQQKMKKKIMSTVFVLIRIKKK